MKNLMGWALLVAPVLLLAERPAGRTTALQSAGAPAVAAAPSAGNDAAEPHGKKVRPGNADDKWPEVAEFMRTN